ncbi:MAG: hypothetical protein Q4E24_05135, partial [bacterium]|nr:hypothetical protein [bacterium]
LRSIEKDRKETAFVQAQRLPPSTTQCTLNSASLHLAHELRSIEKDRKETAFVQAQRSFLSVFFCTAHCLREDYTTCLKNCTREKYHTKIQRKEVCFHVWTVLPIPAILI